MDVTSNRDICNSSKVSGLLCCNLSTNDGTLSIEMLDNFLQWGVSCLDVELPHDEKLEGQPHAVEDVVFPVQMIKGDRVDVLVEKQR